MGEGKPVRCDQYPGQAGMAETAVGQTFCACLRDLGYQLGGKSSSGKTVALSCKQQPCWKGFVLSSSLHYLN